MFNQLDFEKLRPYNDNEVEAAVKRIVNNQTFREVLSFLYRDEPVEKVIERLLKMQTIYEFQRNFSQYAVEEVVRRTANVLTDSGIDGLSANRPYLFIANHRDIVLDSAILQTILFKYEHKTSEITFGSNLMESQLVIDLGKLNKMFTLYRGGSKLQMYKNAALHSSYIRHTIQQKKESIWIAQRDGRTKDGDDKTHLALIKMLVMGKKNLVNALSTLNIVPLSISYEFEPCDDLKVQETYISKREPYKKKPGEDMNSILQGITSYKGNIHIAFGRPLNNILESFHRLSVPDNEFIAMVADEIDNQLHKNFKLWPNNFIAYDLLNNAKQYENVEYTDEMKQAFEKYAEEKISNLAGEKNELRELFYTIYAKPVENMKKANKYELQN
jgi:hypothetical protein